MKEFAEDVVTIGVGTKEMAIGEWANPQVIFINKLRVS